MPAMTCETTLTRHHPLESRKTNTGAPSYQPGPFVPGAVGRTPSFKEEKKAISPQVQYTCIFVPKACMAGVVPTTSPVGMANLKCRSKQPFSTI